VLHCAEEDDDSGGDSASLGFRKEGKKGKWTRLGPKQRKEFCFSFEVFSNSCVIPKPFALTLTLYL
jgi:hypothetical protein